MRVRRPRWFINVPIAIGILVSAAFAGKTSGLMAQQATPSISITKLTITPSPVETLDVVTFAGYMHGDGSSYHDLTVDLDVRGEDGNLVLRATQRGVRLDDGGSQVVYWVWRVPASVPPGTYQVGLSIYGANWSPLYVHAPDLATLEVVPRQ